LTHRDNTDREECMHARLTTAAAMAACLSILSAGAPAGAAEITLVTTAAVEPILRSLTPIYEHTTGNTISMQVYGSPLAVTKLKEGLPADLVLLDPEVLRALAKDGKVVEASITNQFQSRIGAAVRAGAPKPNIATSDALRQTLLDAKSIAHSTGPSGEYFSKTIVVKLGIADQVRPKLMVKPGTPVGATVAKGDAELGIHQVAELMPIGGIDILGPLPDDLQTRILYATALHTGTRQPEATKALVALIGKEATVPIIRKHGMDPAR
jgi:molybdate transport system substrate-binding protein